MVEAKDTLPLSLLPATVRSNDGSAAGVDYFDTIDLSFWRFISFTFDQFSDLTIIDSQSLSAPFA